MNKKKNPRNVTDGDDNAIVQFTGVHYARYVGVQKNTYAHELKHVINIKMKELTLLDSDSNVTIMHNKKHVRNMWSTNDSVHVETNGGNTSSRQKCYITDIGECWFSANSIVNTLSLSDIAYKHKVISDTSEQKAFRVHFPRKMVKFK